MLKHANYAAVICLLLMQAHCAGGESRLAFDGGSRDRSNSERDSAPPVEIGAVDRGPGDGIPSDRSDVGSAMDRGAHEAGAGDGPTRLDQQMRDVSQHDGATIPDLSRDGPAATLDTAPSDLRPDIGPSDPNIGDPCTGINDCRGGASCVLTIGGQGICTIRACTLDDPATSANEDDCPQPWRNACSALPLIGGNTANYCLQRCTPRTTGNDCSAGLACDVFSVNLTQSLKGTVCASSACQADSDCPVLTDRTCDGQTGSGCASGETCTDSDGAGTYLCAKHGHCNLLSGLCEGHSHGQFAVPIGAPCKADTDCGNNMVCRTERGSGNDLRWHNGYCTVFGCAFAQTVPAYGCPTGSSCNLWYATGACQRNCTLGRAADCRDNPADKLGDYECYAWNQLTLDGDPIAATAVCDAPVNCDFFRVAVRRWHHLQTQPP